MEFFLNNISDHSQVKSIYSIAGEEYRNKHPLITGVDGSELAFVLSLLYSATSMEIISVISYDNSRAEQLYSDLKAFLPEDQVFYFPEHHIYPFELTWQSRDVNTARLEVLDALYNKQKGLYIFSLKSALEKYIPANKFWEKTIYLEKGQEALPPQSLAARLTSMGYEHTNIVEQRGQFSFRGGILDVFPVTAEMPSRVEFFDDEIESIREFDLSSQRSLEEYESIHIDPASLLVLGDNLKINQGIERLEKEFIKQKERLTREGQVEKAAELEARISRDLSYLKERMVTPQMYRYLNYFYSHNPATLMEYLPARSMIWLDDPHRIQESEEFYHNEIRELAESLIEEGKILPGESDLFYSFDEVFKSCENRVVSSTNFLRQVPYGRVSETIHLPFQAMAQFYGQWEYFIRELKDWIQQGYQIILFVPSMERAQTLRENLKKEEIGSRIWQQLRESGATSSVLIVEGDIKNGFTLQDSCLAVIAFHELWGSQKQKLSKAKRKKSKKNSVKVSDYRDLKVEDYVVHEKHGIGKYLGIKTLEVGGHYRDYLHIQYKGNDSLYVPTEQIHEIEKYVGKEGRPPKLHSLGTTEWQRVKQRVKSSVKKLAQDLIKLYAERRSRKGYAFSPDTPWQKEFEDYFPFELTSDQEKAVADIKKDLESEKAMDRLLCGDVGYGKTEVAMRAAFKVVMEGKQVCLLVPTTILAQQHYQTFRERFAPYPVDVRVLSRFSSVKEEKKIKQEVKTGRAEIIIGTHKLLSSALKFEDLGLLIIDEEQRFGVQHKEKIKMWKKNVDVLTMTATPIPRTLHMSLVGVRDMSVIETPPEGRFPVQTYVMEHSLQLVREAINRELRRKGQVYVVYNRVKGINAVAHEIKTQVPDARVGLAHGQMPERQLEQVMLDFLEGKYDVLVSTSIVEAGLDIQNVNTIIVYHADKMGLSQLYQLRGRVGRTNRMAYAYLTYQKDKVLSREAEKRLKAIKEFTELGSGFKLALRDLEIRGAGNILGPEQHGFIMSVGFDMYTKMLRSAVDELQGEESGERAEKTERRAADVQMEINISAYLPSTYIADHEQKIDIYQKISKIETHEEVSELAKELGDRFGPLPLAAKNLLTLARLKVAAKNVGISSISRQNQKVILEFHADQQVSGERLLRLTNRFPGKMTVASGSTSLALKIDISGYDEAGLLSLLQFIIKSLEKMVA